MTFQILLPSTPVHREKNKSPSSQPTSSDIFAPEMPPPEALVPEAGSKVYSLWPPHVSMTGSPNLPGEAGRKFRKKRRRLRRRQRLGQFSDLWVGLEER